MIDAQSTDGSVRVGDLRAVLTDLPDDLLVVLSRDEEGNGFSPLAEVQINQYYLPETTWSGNVPHPDDITNGEYDIEDAMPCMVLWPLN